MWLQYNWINYAPINKYITSCETFDIRDISHDEGMKTSAKKRIVVYYAPHLAPLKHCLNGCHSYIVALKLVKKVR